MTSFVSSLWLAPTTNTPNHTKRCLLRPPRRAAVRRVGIASPSTRRGIPVAVTSVGWTTTRESLDSLKIDNDAAPESENPLPGVHFVEPPSMTVADIMGLVRQDVPDEWVNEIARTLLGWRRTSDGRWDAANVPPEWAKSYPHDPPDFIGSPDDYSPQRDMPVRKAGQKLSLSVPGPYKQILKEVLRPHGFRGWLIKDLTPNRTRRAVVSNWILYWYRVHYPDFEWK